MKIEYFYDANGIKLKKRVNDNGSVTETLYAGNFMYRGGSFDFYFHPEGYVAKENSNYKYYYQYKDHLGNIRVSYDNSGSVSSPKASIVEEHNYYPFGLEHKGYNNVVNGTKNKYQMYNGKELNEELGYNVYDYQARHYDPAIGRWLQLDPLAEDMTRFSPYNFAFGNPIYYIDPDGMAPFDNYTIYSDGSILRQKTDDATDSFTYVDSGGSSHDIGTYDKNSSGLIQVPTIDYDSGSTSVTINTKPGNEDRQYISGSALASMIGASADSGQEIYVVSISESDGKSPSPSTSHVNGKNADLRYAGEGGARTPINYRNSKTNFDKIDLKASSSMNASLNKFGYKDIRSSTLTVNTDCIDDCGNGVTISEKYSVPGTNHLKNHYDHEHLQGYRPNVTTRELQKPVSTLSPYSISH